MDMRDSEIVQAKMAARLLSGLKGEAAPKLLSKPLSYF
jgi:hypothetical protein